MELKKMTKDFYDHMKEEQKLLYHSYQESLRQKNERMGKMAVWEPDEETAVFSQIKKLISALYRGLKGWVVQLDPWYLLFLTKDWFYYLCEHYGGSISNWAWNKRWSKRSNRRYKHG
jgi:hypothetical protein